MARQKANGNTMIDDNMESLRDRAFRAALHHEWADRLFPEAFMPLDEALRRAPDGLTDLPIQSLFFEEMATFAARHVPNPESVLEVGGAFGRFAWELQRRTEGIDSYHLSDPDGEKTAWVDQWFTRPDFASLAAQCDLHLHTAPLEGLGKLRKSFDLVVCLNVIDHLPNPRVAVEQLLGLVEKGGHLLLASPLDWHDSITAPGNQVSDLKDLIPKGVTVKAETSALFPLRSRSKRLILFESQAILMGVRGYRFHP